MKNLSLCRSATSVYVAAVLLTGCGGSSASVGLPQIPEFSRFKQAPSTNVYTPDVSVADQIDSPSRFRVLHTFGKGTDGSEPAAPLIDVAGTFYGTTAGGGTHVKDCGSRGYYTGGTVFSITPGGVERVLHSFGKGNDGYIPLAPLIDVAGTLYGTTWTGGAYGECGPGGTVFSITTTGKEQVLHSFGNGADGVIPGGGLIGVNGTLYGTTWGGGAYKGGTVFSITTGGIEKVLHSFGNGTDGNGTDGCQPAAGLINVNGTLYGTTGSCGAYGRGTVFSITTAGIEKVLHSFGNGTDGSEPLAGLTNVKGTLYGTTWGGGAYYPCHYSFYWPCGTVFSITTAGKERLLHSFGNGSDGDQPLAALINVGGTLYGTTERGGNEYRDQGHRVGRGTVFAITTDGREGVVHNFGRRARGGILPKAALLDVKGTLYGTAANLVFALNP